MMTDEAALKLAAAMERLAAAIERVSGSNGLAAGINVYHHGLSPFQQSIGYPSASWVQGSPYTSGLT